MTHWLPATAVGSKPGPAQGAGVRDPERSRPADPVLARDGSANPPGRLHLRPGWPIIGLLVLFPLWYVLGLGAFIWIILAIPIFVHLVLAKTWRVPRGFIIWVFFLIWVALSAIQISHSANWLTYAYRTTSYLAATLAFIYLVNTSEEELPTRRIINALTIFWIVVVIGGYAAMAAPHLSFSTPTQKLLGHLGSNKLLLTLIHPTLAQAQALGGVASLGRAIARPAAPFAYTNWWGANFAFLVPFVVIALLQARTRLVRWGLAGMLVVSLGPFVYSINRGAWLSLIAGGVYAWIRFAARRRTRAVLGGLAAIALIALIVFATPLGSVVQARLGHKGSASTRISLIQQSSQGALSSPVVGYGVPLPQPVSQYSLPNVGTQGQLWLVLVSVGVPGTAFFLLWLLYVFWCSRSTDDRVSFAVHVAILIGLLQLPFYGWMPAEMFLVMTAAALVWRNRDQSVPDTGFLEATSARPLPSLRA
jgi:polysaccharide biosynthesis protein PslJ